MAEQGRCAGCKHWRYPTPLHKSWDEHPSWRWCAVLNGNDTAPGACQGGPDLGWDFSEVWTAPTFGCTAWEAR